MTDPRQHQRSRFNLAFNSVAHINKSSARRPHLCCASRRKRHVSATPKSLSRGCQTFDWTQLIAQINKGNQGKEKSIEHHIDEQLMGFGSRNTAAIENNFFGLSVYIRNQTHNIIVIKVDNFDLEQNLV